jgi:hypothetical protein
LSEGLKNGVLDKYLTGYDINKYMKINENLRIVRKRIRDANINPILKEKIVKIINIITGD